MTQSQGMNIRSSGECRVRCDMVDAYYSNELKCWVRLEREADGEWCHTSGFSTREAAIRGREV
jgi:hypothetical protein